MEPKELSPLGVAFVFSLALLFATIVGGISGCATEWTHSTKNAEDFYTDKAACNQAAGNMGGFAFIAVHSNCMKAKGWK